MRFLGKIGSLLDEIDGAAQEASPASADAASSAAASLSPARLPRREDIQLEDEGRRGDIRHSEPLPPETDQETAASGISVDASLEDHHTAGRRSPAPSSVSLTSAPGGQVDDLHTQAMSGMSGSSQWIHLEKESLETLSSRSAVGSVSGHLEEAHRSEEPVRQRSDQHQAETSGSDSPMEVITDSAAQREAGGDLDWLQRRMKTLEIESAEKQAKLVAVSESLSKSEQKVRELQVRLRQAEDMAAASKQRADQSGAALQAVEAEAAELRRRAPTSSPSSANQQDVNTLRDEMEKELAVILGKKDEQVKALRAEAASNEKIRRDQAKELEKCRHQIEDLQEEVAALQETLTVKQSEHDKTLESALEEQRRRAAELEQQRDMEHRQKHELAINVRSVEERARGEIARLEAEHAQLTLQLSVLQGHLEAEQQKCIDLSTALGDATQRLTQSESTSGLSVATLEEARSVAEAEARDLRDKLSIAEDKLLDAQSMRDTFAKETDMYRTELKAARDERKQLEEELSRCQERIKEVASGRGDGEVVSQTVMQSMQKEFEERVERYKDEVQYLRQKCEEKGQRCEQLLAEKSSLAVQLRNAGVGLDPPGDPSSAADLEAGVKAKVSASRGLVRALPAGTPTWLRSIDEAFRTVVRTLAASPSARVAFFGYVVLMHMWVLFVLQHAAVPQ